MVSSPAYSKYLREPIVTIPPGPVCGTGEKRVQKRGAGLIHDVSATGSTFFIEPMSAVNANNALRELAMKEKKERLSGFWQSCPPRRPLIGEDISDNYRLLTQLDVIFAKSPTVLPDAGGRPADE